ncbi:MAG: hypothetical protein ABI175_11270 [Polyangiales bacterium]
MTERANHRGEGEGGAMPSHALTRQIGHDLRGLLAAATTNIEYIRELAGFPEDGVAVTQEIENELRLTADVIELLASPHDAARAIEIDLRGFFWLARRSGGFITLDATMPPFLVRGPFGAIEKLVAAIGAASSEGTTLEIDDSSLRVRGLDRAKAEALTRVEHGLRLSLELRADGVLVLCRV